MSASRVQRVKRALRACLPLAAYKQSARIGKRRRQIESTLDARHDGAEARLRRVELAHLRGNVVSEHCGRVDTLMRNDCGLFGCGQQWSDLCQRDLCNLILQMQSVALILLYTGVVRAASVRGDRVKID